MEFSQFCFGLDLRYVNNVTFDSVLSTVRCHGKKVEFLAEGSRRKRKLSDGDDVYVGDEGDEGDEGGNDDVVVTHANNYDDSTGGDESEESNYHNSEESEPGPGGQGPSGGQGHYDDDENTATEEVEITATGLPDYYVPDSIIISAFDEKYFNYVVEQGR